MSNLPDFSLTTLVVGSGIWLLTLAVGMSLQIKLIRAIKQDRTTGWEIDFGHSVVMMIHFSFVTFYTITTYAIPNLLKNLWFYYISYTLRMLGNAEISYHSLTISFYKYVFIVHHNMIASIGELRMKKILLVVGIFNPIAGSLAYIFRPNYQAFESMHNNDRRFAQFDAEHDKYHVSSQQSNVSIPSRLFMCGYDDLDWDSTFEYFVNILTGVFCTGQVLLAMLIYSNLIEMLLYICIFRHIQR